MPMINVVSVMDNYRITGSFDSDDNNHVELPGSLLPSNLSES